MYSEKVLELFQNPPNVGVITKADGVGEVGNAACGDIMRIYLKVDNGTIVDAKFKTFGCAAAIQASSVACTMIVGKTVDEALTVRNSDVIKKLGDLPPQKTHCSMLAQEAIAAAVADYKKNIAKNQKKK